MSEIIPCPFCGSENVGFGVGNIAYWKWVHCAVCGAAGPDADNNVEAIAKWNTRTAPVAPRETRVLLDFE